VLGQISASYKLSDDWTAGLLSSVSAGSRRSQHGSDPESATLLLSLVRYF
jgi:hypothetical protein